MLQNKLKVSLFVFVFQSDFMSSINDRDADELSDMMAGIPSRPASMAR